MGRRRATGGGRGERGRVGRRTPLSDGQCTVRGSRQSGGCRRAAAAAASPHPNRPSLLSRPTMQLYAPSSRVHEPPLSFFFHCFRRFLSPSSTVRVRAYVHRVRLSPALFSGLDSALFVCIYRGGAPSLPPEGSLGSLSPRILTTLDLDLFFHRGIRELGTAEFRDNGIRWGGVRRVLEMSRGFNFCRCNGNCRNVFVDLVCDGVAELSRVTRQDR